MSTPAAALRRVVPETIQTSGMDCGPAALHSLLAGFGVPVSYGRLREACQTDVDGTSIDALESVARALGLDVAQLMLPADHVALTCATAMPAIAVALLPSGMPHFVLAWRRHGRLVQVMDPATGRRIVGTRALTAMLYIHEQAVPFAAWEAFAAAPTFQDALRERLGALGLRRRAAAEVVARAQAGGGRAMAALDAQARALAAAAGGGSAATLAPPEPAAPAAAAARPFGRGVRAQHAFALDRAVDDPGAALAELPPEAWFARPTTADAEPAEVMLRGAVLVRARELAAEPPDPATLTPDLAAALTEPPPRPARRLLAAARAAGRVAIAPLALAIALLAGGAVAETALLRGSLDAGDVHGALLVVAGIAGLLAGLETLAAATAMGIGRRLEIGLRRALAATLPRLPDRYLRSRPPSDMAERAHALHELRSLPLLATQLLAAALETLFVAVALCVLDPAATPYVALATIGALGVALVVQLPLRERELRAREHASALGQTTLDAVLGVLAIRAHGAERAVRSEHDVRLRGWIGAAQAAVRARTAATFAQTACGIGLAIPVVVIGIDHLDSAPARLLLVLWAVTIPSTAERVGQIALQWPQLRTLALRLAEPLDATSSAALPECQEVSDIRSQFDIGAEVVFDEATVRATGQDVLAPTTLRVAPGEHVALVGLSGAGKSTLLALALGLADASDGSVAVGGLEPRAMWPAVAWVDPQVRVWNRDLAHNVAPLADEKRLRGLIASAELGAVAARVDGEALGADGGLLSGGEAQRVRLARALDRDGVRLAVLDEPLRGLDRAQRHRLLATARERWCDATMLCATHDIVEALSFDRVLVMEGGRVVADGRPEALLTQSDSPLQAMLDAERALRGELDSGRGWRRLRVSDGGLQEEARAEGFAVEQEPAAAQESSAAPKRTAAETSNAAPEPTAAPEPSAAREPFAAQESSTTSPDGPSPDRRRGAAPALVVFAIATIMRYAAFAASWSVIGAAIFTDGGSLTTWALLLAATVPLAAIAEAAEGRAAIALGARLRERTLRGALALDASWVRREGPGRILGRSMEVDAIARLAAGGGLGAGTAAIELSVAAVALLASAPGRVAALPLAAVLVAAGFIAASALRRRRAWAGARLSETDELLEAIAGQRTRLIQGDHEAERRAQRLDDYARLGAAADRPLAALAGALPRAALAGGLAGLAVAGDLSDPADVALALGGILLATQALRRIAAAVETLGSAAIARRALDPILAAKDPAGEAIDTRPARREGSGGAARHAEREGSAGETPAAESEGSAAAPDPSPLRVCGLGVVRAGRDVLRDVDLELRPGDRVVLSGPSGAGKSTLAAALAGLLPAAHGTIALGDAHPGDHDWRTRVGFVPQHGDNHVLLAPVAFNLLLGRSWPPAPQDLADAAAICHELGLGPLLARMPAGIGQVVGETGWRLSQGERARLCLARALLADHDVLILDEPLGALDPHTARTILDVVRRRARTLVVISQSDRGGGQASARTAAVTATATTTPTSTFAPRHSAIPAAATPAVCGPTASDLPSVSAETTTSAASSAGAISPITPADHDGSSRPPIVTGPKPLISAVTTAHPTTTTHSSVLMAPKPRAGFAAPPAQQGSRRGSGCPPA